jgi:hypothetical protein
VLVAGRHSEICLQVGFASPTCGNPRGGEVKAKERRKVGKGDDTVIVEDTSDEDDEETLQ